MATGLETVSDSSPYVDELVHMLHVSIQYIYFIYTSYHIVLHLELFEE